MRLTNHESSIKINKMRLFGTGHWKNKRKKQDREKYAMKILKAHTIHLILQG
jgi:hypothetical protein